MVENTIQMKSGITINVDASVKIQKNIMRVNKIIFGILLQAVVKMANIQKSIIDNSVITEAVAKSHDEETKTAQTKTVPAKGN